MTDSSDCPIVGDEKTGTKWFPDEYNNRLLQVDETQFNITQDKLLEIFKYDIDSYEKLVTIVPINGSGKEIRNISFG